MAQEQVLEQWAKREAAKRGWLCFKFKSPSQAGVPDRIFITFNRRGVIFVEFKAPGKAPTRLQSHWHKALRDYGCKVYVIDSKEKMNELFKLYD